MSERHYPVASIIRFVKEADGRGLCFGGWQSGILEIYLKWHHQNGSLVLVEEEGNLVALAIGTKCDEADINQHWLPWNEAGNAMYLSDIVAKTKRGVAACVAEFASRCKDWREMNLYARRRDKMTVMKTQVFERILERWK